MFVSTAYAAAAETAEHSGGTFPPFDPTYFPSQLVWLAITFGFLYFVMSRMILPRIGDILEVRRDRIAQDMEETKRLKDEADSAIAAYEHELSQAKAKAHDIGAKATEETRAQAEAERHAAEEELAAKISEAEKDIAQIRDKAMAEVGSIASDTAQSIVTQLMGGRISKAEITKAVEAAEK